ncbi:hypothetical protein P692DRAFT_20803925 [Suillus brevipes Sb2]|nr:hypothetical protein P692DRAFT_20803925 [Suillus brevipes Sb2]
MFKLTSHTAGNSFLIAAAAALKSLLTLAFDCRPFLNHKSQSFTATSSGSWCVHPKGPSTDDENSKHCLPSALSGPFRRSQRLHLSSARRFRNALVKSCHCPTASETIALRQHPKKGLFA